MQVKVNNNNNYEGKVRYRGVCRKSELLKLLNILNHVDILRGKGFISSAAKLPFFYDK